MSRLREKHDVIAIACSDLHFSHNAPISRSVENWYDVMLRYIRQLGSMADEYDVPILYAGDIFDTPRPPVELVNFIITCLPVGYAVPGQHDLPHHIYGDVHKTGYWNLVEAGTLKHLDPQIDVHVTKKLVLTGFPWGCPIVSPIEKVDKIRVAVVHSYIWKDGFKIPDADEQDHADNYGLGLEGYDAAVFGDNHKGFLTKVGKCNVCNCGTFIRRKIDEKDYTPRVALIHEDGSITRRKLDTSLDEWIEAKDEIIEKEEIDLNDMLEEFKEKTDRPMNFREAVHQTIKQEKPSQEVRRILLDSIEEN